MKSLHETETETTEEFKVTWQDNLVGDWVFSDDFASREAADERATALRARTDSRNVKVNRRLVVTTTVRSATSWEEV